METAAVRAHARWQARLLAHTLAGAHAYWRARLLARTLAGMHDRPAPHRRVSPPLAQMCRAVHALLVSRARVPAQLGRTVRTPSARALRRLTVSHVCAHPQMLHPPQPDLSRAGGSRNCSPLRSLPRRGRARCSGLRRNRSHPSTSWASSPACREWASHTPDCSPMCPHEGL